MVRVPLHSGAAPVCANSRIRDILYPPPPASEAAETALVEVAADELVNPITGEIVDSTSIDDLIDCYEYIDRKDKQLYAVKQKIKALLLARTEGDAATRRVAGARRIAKLSLPSESFQQSELKRLWRDYPDLATRYLRIESLAVQLKEFNKLRTTSSDQEDLVTFRDILTEASNGRAGLPTVTIEK